MITSPKQRFLQSQERVRAWNSIVEQSVFQEALDMTMLELLDSPARALPVYDAQAATHQIAGARKFMTTLAGLGLISESRSKGDPETLEYESVRPQEGMKPQSEVSEL